MQGEPPPRRDRCGHPKRRADMRAWRKRRPAGALGRAVSADGRDCRGAARKRGSLRCACTLPPEGTGRTPVRRSQGPVRRAGCGRPGQARVDAAPRPGTRRCVIPGTGVDQGICGRACGPIVSRWAPWTAACNSPRSNLFPNGKARRSARQSERYGGPETGSDGRIRCAHFGRRSSQVPDDAAHLAGVEVAGRGERHSIASPDEQLGSEESLKLTNMPADGAGRDPQFGGRVQETLMSARRFECLERVQRRKWLIGHVFPARAKPYRRRQDEYERETDTFVPTEPTIEGVQAVEDDLAAELQRSGLPDAGDIARVIENTADAFLRGDFNGCLGKRALADVGLVDEDAASDIRDLRSLLSAVRIAKRTAWQTVVRLITTGLILALIAGVTIKLKLFGGY